MPKIQRTAPKKKAPPKKKKITHESAKQGILSTVHSLSDGLPESGIKINIYGQSGTGKTTFWGTFPGRILALVCSGNDQPGELRSLLGPDTKDKVDYIVVEDSSQLLEIIEEVQDSDLYETVVLDHLSGLQDMILVEVLSLKERPVQLSWGIAKQEQWGEVANLVKHRLRSLLNLTTNVVIVAQERAFDFDEEDDSVLMPYVASGVTPSIVGWLNPAVDYIVQTYKQQNQVEKITKLKGKTVKKMVPGEGVEYRMRIGPHSVFTTKFRKPKGGELPQSIIDPTYDKVMEYITGT